MSIRKLILCCITGLSLSACAVGPNYKTPILALQSWSQQNNENAVVTEWWSVFNDPFLTSLIKKQPPIIWI